MQIRKALVLALGGAVAIVAVSAVLSTGAAQNRMRPVARATDSKPGEYHSPFDLAYSPDGKWLAVSDRTAGKVVLIDAATQKITREVALGKPLGLAWSADSSQLFAVDYQSACVAQIGPSTGAISRKLPAGPHPISAAVAARRQLLLVTNSAFADVSVLDLKSGKEIKKIPAVREPFWVSISPDESTAIVSNLLPAGAASEPGMTADVSIIDLENLVKVADVPLPPNTTCIRQTAISPDGKWAYAVHTVGRTALPSTQLERGWVNTDALSIIDLKAKGLYATVLLDTLSEGAADPWGIAISKDGATMWISVAGVHQITKIDLAGLHKALLGDATLWSFGPERRAYSQPTIWSEIKADPTRRAGLVNDLSALYIAGLINRVNIPGKAPRGISVSPDGNRLAVGMYFSGQVLLLDSKEVKVSSTIDFGNQASDDVRLGEQIFHDATYSFQHWLSCATCHPNDGRVDGLDWDLPNDGIGNPKNAKSLLYAHRTPPVMWLGVREDMDAAAMAGFRFTMYQPKSEEVRAVQTYIRSLVEEPSPYLVNGQLSEKAKRGKAIYEDNAVGCTHCHSGELHTNLKAITVGTHGELDHDGEDAFVTPPLVELWRTGPYLHDGRAATIQDIFTKFNPHEKHGKTTHLSKEQIDDLAEYLLSL